MNFMNPNINTDKNPIPVEEFTDELTFAINEQPSDSIKIKLHGLYKNQLARDEVLEKGYNEEFYQIEYKYILEYQKINKEINEIVNRETPIKNYWKLAIQNSKFFPVNKKDEQILNFLYNVDLIYDEKDKKSFTVRFFFSKNEFFDHPIIEKKYTFDKKEDQFVDSCSTEIKWKISPPNIKNVIKKIKKGKKVNTITSEKPCPSFFDIFLDIDDEKREDNNEPDITAEADFIQNDLIPFSMEYFIDIQKLNQLSEDAEIAEINDDINMMKSV